MKAKTQNSASDITFQLLDIAGVNKDIAVASQQVSNANLAQSYSQNIIDSLKIISVLGKVKITFFVAFSSALGYILSGGNINFNFIFAVLGVFILSTGASAFNQWQEYKQDSLMNRTKSRPIPKKSITPKTGFIIALALSLAGLGILSFTGNYYCFLLGLFAIFWYNLVYTPLKMKTSFAIIPGALVGSIPPVIGWIAGGGSLFDPQNLVLALFFFIWQMPHFWLLLMVYENEYKQAGFPVLTQIFNITQLRRLTYIWIVGLVVSCMLIPLFNTGSNNLLTGILLFTAGLILLWRTKNLLSIFYQNKSLKFAFIDINVYVLAVAILLSVDKLIFF